MGFIWAFGILINALLQTTYTYSSAMDACGIDFANGDIYNRWYVMLIITIILEFYLPLVVFIGLNGHIYLNLKSQISKMSEISPKESQAVRSKRDENLAKATRNIFQLMVIMTSCYCLCWGWNSIYLALWLAGIIKGIPTGNFFLNSTCSTTSHIDNFNSFIYLMHFYSIHVIAEFNLSGSEIICRQIYTVSVDQFRMTF